VMSGASLHEVQKLLGHSDVGMTQRYAHMVDDSLQRATDGVSSAIEEATSSPVKSHTPGYSPRQKTARSLPQADQ